MKRTSLVVVAVLTTFLAAAPSAAWNKGKNELNKFKYVSKFALQGDKRCGSYFVRSSFGGRREDGIFYLCGKNRDVKLSWVSSGKVIVEIDKKRRRPTVSSVFIEGPNDKSVGVGRLIRISPADYDEAKDCLPQPTK
jgi:hypothetical protein